MFSPVFPAAVQAAFAGFLLGASFIVAIGSQNAFVLQSGLRRQHVGKIIMVCMLGDIALIAAGAFGLGTILQTWPWLKSTMTLAGSVFLTAYGIKALYRAARPDHETLQLNAQSHALPWQKTILTAMAFTFLNPHVYLDTVILLGSIANHYAGFSRVAFAIGAMSASVLWFTALGYGARLLAPLFTKPIAWRVLDMVIGLCMLLIAGGLGYSFIAGS